MGAFAMRAGSLAAMLALAIVVSISAAVARPGPHAAYAPIEPDRSYMMQVSGYGQAPVRLYVEEFGRGRPILLLHGLGASGYTWRHLIKPLSRHNRVITLDLKGFGRSEKPFDRAYTPLHHASLVSSFIRKRRLHDMTLVGHSYGGAVALIVTLDLNRRERGRIRNLVLMNAPAYSQPSTSFVSFMRAPVLPYAVLSMVPPELATWLSLSPVHQQKTTRADVRAYADPFYDAAARHALISTSRQIRDINVAAITARYPSIRQRTLVIWCRDDETVPLSTGVRLSKTLPRARLKVLDRCSHAPQDEQPRAVSRLFHRFLN